VQAITTNVVNNFRDTSLVGMTALLASLLLHICPCNDPATLPLAALPPQVLSTAHAVLVTTNCSFILARSDMQAILAAADLCTELLYCVSFLVAFCSAHWSPNEEGREVGCPSVEISVV
jgi:hypothetical protein